MGKVNRVLIVAPTSVCAVWPKEFSDYAAFPYTIKTLLGDKGKRLKIYYITQPSTNPPTFVCFVNSADLFHFSYQRYLENRIRETFGMEGTPIRFVIREKSDKDKK